MRPRRSLFWALLLIFGCGSEDETTAPPPPGPLVCAANEIQTANGCVVVGVPPEACAVGFESDEAGGCTPILPPEPCGPGQMAVPGEMACHDVAPCGAAPWGDIPVDGGTVYVDGAFTGTSTGSPAQPFTSIQDGVDNAPPGGLVAVAAGTYTGPVTIGSKAVRLWGVCPALTQITAAADMAVAVYGGANGTEIHTLSASGVSASVGVTDANDVLVDRVWTRGAGRGVTVENTLGPASATLSGVLVDSATENGIYFEGVTGVVEKSVVRDGSTPANEAALWIQIDPAGPRANVTITGSLLERNRDLGMFIGASDVTVEGTVVRDMQARPDGLSGRAFEIIDYAPTLAPSNVTLRGLVIERTLSEAVFGAGSNVTIENTVVRDTQPNVAMGFYGRGVAMEPDPMSMAPSSLTVRASLLERNHEQGLYVSWGLATVETTWIRDTYPRLDQLGGRGLEVHDDLAGATTIMATHVLVERSVDTGVFLAASGSLDGVVVRGTTPAPVNNLFGDGMSVIFFPELSVAAPSVQVTGGRLEWNARAAISVHTAAAAVGGNTLECNVLELDREGTATLTDLGGNVCGCNGKSNDCKIISENLAPPGPLGGG
jgi:parallel beta helix pectate lyase-like protein